MRVVNKQKIGKDTYVYSSFSVGQFVGWMIFFYIYINVLDFFASVSGLFLVIGSIIGIAFFIEFVKIIIEWYVDSKEENKRTKSYKIESRVDWKDEFKRFSKKNVDKI